MDAATRKLEAAHGQQINQRPGVDIRTRSTTPRNYEVKWSGPDGVVLDVSESGWGGAPCSQHDTTLDKRSMNRKDASPRCPPDASPSGRVPE